MILTDWLAHFLLFFVAPIMRGEHAAQVRRLNEGCVERVGMNVSHVSLLLYFTRSGLVILCPSTPNPILILVVVYACALK